MKKVIKKFGEVLLLFLAVQSMHAMATVFYLSTNGDDSNDGLSPVRSVATLTKALELARWNNTPLGNTVLVSPGLYKGQVTTLRLATGMPEISIKAADNSKKPVFESSNHGTWLRLVSSKSLPVPLLVDGMVIRNYGAGISLEGPKIEKVGISSIRITNNHFENIGTAQPPPSTAALRLINVQGAQISGNHFFRINNFGSNQQQDCVLLHPIYLAHGSSGNLIEGNKFEDNCGVAIKLRDASNDNLIRNNHFTQQQLKKLLQDWYCDTTRRKDCRKKDECPSWNNIFIGNSLDSRLAGIEEVDIHHGDRPNSVCVLPAVRNRVEIRN